MLYFTQNCTHLICYISSPLLHIVLNSVFLNLSTDETAAWAGGNPSKIPVIYPNHGWIHANDVTCVWGQTDSTSACLLAEKEQANTLISVRSHSPGVRPWACWRREKSKKLQRDWLAAEVCSCSATGSRQKDIERQESCAWVAFSVSLLISRFFWHYNYTHIFKKTPPLIV